MQDPKNRHELDRKMVKELVCALCDTRQPVSQQCQQCHVAFGAYTCMDCVFFDDEVEKKQFHCGECGICRVGGRERFFHCKTCGCCYDKRMQVCKTTSSSQHATIHGANSLYLHVFAQMLLLCLMPVALYDSSAPNAIMGLLIMC